MTTTTASRIVGVVLAAAVVAAAGAGGMYLYLRGAAMGSPAANPSAAVPASERPHELAITLPPGAAARAGIQSARPAPGQAAATIAVPAIVEPNGYRQVVVRSVAPGQVRSVLADLGTAVRRGDLLATIHTPDLAETVRVYLSMKSEFDAAHQRLTRLESLVKIGAASRQELEAAEAEHTRHATDVESARARMTLLGVTPGEVNALTASTSIDSLVRITSPADGVIVTRAINQGVNIDASADLFTIVDLDSVWVVASVYERDLARIQIGSPAVVSTPAAPRTWNGRITYIDPQLAADTRTAKIRVEIANPDRALRLGMYADVALAVTPQAAALLLPGAAIQTIGSQPVVYVVDAARAGRYVERSVSIGATVRDQVEITAGITAEDEVVTSGSFALRAERDRLGLPAPAPANAARVEIAITREGFVPGSVAINRGEAADLVFTRRTEETCAKEIVVPSMNVRRALPLNESVTIHVPSSDAREIAFACGMNMLRGTVVVR